MRLRRVTGGAGLLLGRHRDKTAVGRARGWIRQALAGAGFEGVRRTDYEGITILVVARLAREREGRARALSPGVRRTVGDLELRAELVHAHGGVVVTVRLLQVLPGEVVDFVVRCAVLAADIPIGEKYRARTLEVVVVLSVHPGLYLPRDVPRVDVLLVDAAHLA